MEQIEIRVVDKAHSSDINISNHPFSLFGRLLPAYVNGKWSYGTEMFDMVSEMCFPDENYNFDELSKNSIILGAYMGDICIGLAILQHSWNKYLYLYDLKVNPEYRGRHVGTLLMDEAKKISKREGYRGIYTQGQDNNLAACLFYLKNGFHIGGINTDVYRGTKQDGKMDVIFYFDYVDSSPDRMKASAHETKNLKSGNGDRQ